MATMLNGAAVMDGALLLVAANETCPQPQTSEHLAAIEIMRLQHILILQNKIDLIRCGPAAHSHHLLHVPWGRPIACTSSEGIGRPLSAHPQQGPRCCTSMQAAATALHRDGAHGGCGLHGRA